MGAISPILPRPAILTFASILALAAILTIILLHTFRFRQQHLTGKFEFSGFRINIDQFHTYPIPLFQYILHFLYAFVIDLGHVQQTIFTRQEFHESTESGNCLYNSLVNLSNFRFAGNSLDAGNGNLDWFCIGGSNIHDTLITHFFNNDNRSGFLLNILNNLSSGANDSSDLILIYCKRNHTRCVRFQVRTRFR